MTLGDAISTHAEANVAVNAIISGRVYPQALPQTVVLPALVYRRVTGNHRTVLEGPNGTCVARYQFESWASTYSVAERLRNAVRTAFHGFKGTMGGMGGVTILATFFPQDMDQWDGTTRKHVLKMDLFFDYSTDTESA